MTRLAEELNAKMKLERRLLPKIRGYHAEVLAAFKDEGAFIASRFDDDLRVILLEHYNAVSDVFRGHMQARIDDDLAFTSRETEIFLTALSVWFDATSRTQAEAINDTATAEMEQAEALAAEDEIVRELTGREAGITAAAISGGIFQRKLRARESGILVTETQMVAEAVKGTEVEVLLGITPAITARTPRRSTVTKEWVSVGDSRVREAHLEADSQIRTVTEPFSVGGELLNRPGDRSLGATAKNIIGCRCSADYDAKAIEGARRV